MMPKPPAGQTDLAAEQRRRNVREVREAAAELREVEGALLDAQARIPALVGKVQAIRERIERRTQPIEGDDADHDPGKQ